MQERLTPDARLDRIEGRLENIENRLAQVPTREEMDARVDHAREEMNARLDRVPTREEMNARFDRVPTREEMDARLAAHLDEFLHGVRADGEQTRAHFEMVYERMADIVRLNSEAVRAVETRVDNLETGHEALQGRVERVELRLDAGADRGSSPAKKRPATDRGKRRKPST